MTVLTSPCVGICRLDESTGLCVGCARDRDEIGGWSTWTATRRRAVWARLASRRAASGLGHPVLDLSTADTERRLLDSLRARTGTWTIGTHGGLAEFSRVDDEPVACRDIAEGVVLETSRGALGVAVTTRLRAFAADPEAGPVTYALFHEKLPPHPPALVREIGPDRDSLDPDRRDALLFDLGLGRRQVAFMVRTGDARLIDRLRAAEGVSLMADAELRATLIEASPHRVVKSPLARIEVYQPIARGAGASPDGPHTHLLTDLLALGLDQDPALGLPETYFGVLTHYAQPA